MEPSQNELHTKPKPLAGVKVLEMGQLLAGPFATVLLAWFGAEVIKIEPPGTGDPLRSWRTLHKGTSLWWYSLARNKKCITLDLRQKKGQEIALRLGERMDVIVENFKPGTLEKWGLGFEDVKAINPRVIMARISGWGQTGPNARKPGFAAVGEGVGGLRYVTGDRDRPPVRPNLSLGDSLTGLHAALGILTALYHRDAQKAGTGQVVDVAIYESVFNMMESTIPEYDKAGVVREREGTRLSGIVPTGTYVCKDDVYVIIGANGDNLFKRLMAAIGRPEMASDPRFEHNDDRVPWADEIDQAISDWTLRLPSTAVIRILESAAVPVGPIYSAKDMMADPHFQARGLFQEVDLGGGDKVRLPAILPRLTETPGSLEWPGPQLSAHNREIYGGLLGYSDEEIEKLSAAGII
jgi:crotonobetainyl-CoA:carnitine CoA-transferase CaiB-like acyl-CoA transferase